MKMFRWSKFLSMNGDLIENDIVQSCCSCDHYYNNDQICFPYHQRMAPFDVCKKYKEKE